YHHGGREEAQFNVGMYPEYLRVGLGFEFSQKKGGQPSNVALAYACFVNEVRSAATGFERLVRGHGWQVEWQATDGAAPEHVPAERVVEWLQRPTREVNWVFVGRLLDAGRDRAVLADAEALGAVISG